MRPLTVEEVTVGMRVLFAGGADAGDVLDERKRAAGHILVEHHPGVIRELLGTQHVLVDFVGLEDEPVSFGVGFGYDEETGIYPGLLVPGESEWQDMISAGWWA